MNLGTIIAENRKKLGLTQEGLAQRLGVTNQAVSKWESDQSCPDIALLPLLADLFGITLDELFGRALPVAEPVALVPVTPELPWADDDTLRIVVYRGHTYLADCPEKEKITFEYKGPALNVECAVNLSCDQVNGNVCAGGNVSCDDVNGNIMADGNVSCDDVDGIVSAGGSVSCDCVEGNVNAGGNVTCDEVEGSVYAGGDVICDEIGEGVNAGGSVKQGRSSFHLTVSDCNDDGEENSGKKKKGFFFRL